MESMEVAGYSEEESNRKIDEVHALFRERYGRFVRAMKRLGCEHHRSPNMKSITTSMVLEEILKLVDEEGGTEGTSYWSNYTVWPYLDCFRRGRYPLFGMPVDFEDKIEAAIDQVTKAKGGGDVFNESVTPEAVFELLDDDLKASLPFHAAWLHLGIVREIIRRHRRRQRPDWALKPCRFNNGKGFYHLTPTHAPPDGSGKPPRKLLPRERFALIGEVRKKYNQPEVEEESDDEEEESEFVKELRQQYEMEQKERADRYHQLHNPEKPRTVLRVCSDSDSKLRLVESVLSHDEEKAMEEKERELHNPKKFRFCLDLYANPRMVARVLSRFGASS